MELHPIGTHASLAPRWPHLLQRMRGPNAGTGSSSSHLSTLTVVYPDSGH